VAITNLSFAVVHCCTAAILYQLVYFLRVHCLMLPPYTHLGDVEEIFNPLGVSLGASES
jgi:hypothetical protein